MISTVDSKMTNSGSQMLFFSLSLLLLSLAGNVAGKDLSSVTYRFTTCGKQGRLGPTFEECSSHYRSTGSIVAGHLTEQDGFAGGQEFTFPRSGRYAIRIAGAAGGRGVCSIRGGYGTVISVEVDIEQGVNDIVLILVGQRGTSACHNAADYTSCQTPPINLTEASTCSSAWNVLNTGGGGGGGGSMVWPRGPNDTYSVETDPIVAAAGGGGSSAILNYNSAILGSVIPLNNRTIQEYYIDWINGQPLDEDELNANDSGSTGNRPSSENAAGFGSGWHLPTGPEVPESFAIQPVDGNLLSQNASFAIGGVDCPGSGSKPFDDIYGGFGGGGGACSEGGGGGGYGGGWVLDRGNIISGRGGYSFFGNLNETILLPNKEDGYVEIYPLDCGCFSGKCLIEGDTFACVCLDGARLWSDNVTCIKDLTRTIMPNEITEMPLQISERRTISLTFTQLEMEYSIFTADVSLSRTKRMKREATATGTCVVVFVDTNGSPVLISKSNENDQAMALIPRVNDSFSLEPRPSLDVGVAIAGVLVLSEYDCSITSLTFDYNADDIPSISNVTLESILANSQEFLKTIASDFLSEPEEPSLTSSLTTPTSVSTPPSTISTSPSASVSVNLPKSTSFSTTNVIIIAVVAGLAVILLIVIVCAIVLVVYKKKHSKTTIYQVHSRNSLANNMNGTNGKEGGTLQRRGTLQRLKTRIMSLTSNPNYGETDIGGVANNDDFIDLGPPQTASDVNLYDSVNLSNSLKRNSGIHGRIGSKKDLSTTSIAGAFRLRSRSRRRTFTLKPKYGVMSPTYNFYEFNLKRQEEDSWEYDRTQLTYLREIGEGQFGKVLLMKAKNIAGFNGKLPVAVKTLTSIDDEDVKKFLEEVDLMKKFCHPNIVSLLGVNSQHSEGAPLMILEYMPYGDLQSFLKRHKPKGPDSSLIGQYHHKKFARDVALALNFLSENHYVHRDVAARNCLVGPSLEVKLADFGMARGVHEKEYYRIAGKAVLPVRWMAPESLLYGMFSSSSDVWSYGVLLWEIVMYGDMPLESMAPQQIVEMAQAEMLKHPWPADSICEDLMSIKNRCHIYNQEKRITFTEIIELLPTANDPPIVGSPL